MTELDNDTQRILSMMATTPVLEWRGWWDELRHYKPWIGESNSYSLRKYLVKEHRMDDFDLGKKSVPEIVKLLESDILACRPSADDSAFVAVKSSSGEKAESGSQAGATTSETVADGPCGLNGFRWRTLAPRTGLAPTPFRLLAALWNAKDRTASFCELAKAVWDDAEINLRDDSRLGSARREVNDFMESGAFPFRVRTSPKNEVVALVESMTQTTVSPKSTFGKKARKSPRLARQ